jgi:hypothetical protein
VTDDEDATLATSRRSWRSSLFTPTAEQELSDPELRERMRTLDTTERKWGFGASGFVLVLSLLLVPSLLHNTKVAASGKPTRAGCADIGDVWSVAKKTCYHVYHPSDFVLEFILLVVIGAVLLFAVWKSMRALTIFTSLFIGLAAIFVGVVIVGFVALAYGGWLLTRSWRLQRFGAKDSKTVRKVASERAEERKEARAEAKASPAGAGAAKSSVTPSKRYTPKSKPRRK